MRQRLHIVSISRHHSVIHLLIKEVAAIMDAKLTIVDVTGSTNDDLLEAGKQGEPHGTGLAARAQTAGRGRRGHKWDSTAGNLLLSIVLRPRVDPAKYSGLAAVSGLAVLEALVLSILHSHSEPRLVGRNAIGSFSQFF